MYLPEGQPLWHRWDEWRCGSSLALYHSGDPSWTGCLPGSQTGGVLRAEKTMPQEVLGTRTFGDSRRTSASCAELGSTHFLLPIGLAPALWLPPPSSPRRTGSVQPKALLTVQSRNGPLSPHGWNKHADHHVYIKVMVSYHIHELRASRQMDVSIPWGPGCRQATET